MKLLDLQPRTAVILEVDIGNNVYTMETKVASVDYDILLLAPIFSKEQLLDFSMGIFKEATFNLYAMTNNGATRLQWKNVSVEMYRRKNLPFYKVSVSAFNSLAKNANRRGNNRFPVLAKCNCCIIETGAVFPAEMADISVSGIAFLLRAQLPLNRVYLDIDFDDVTGGVPFHIHVQAQCIRVMPKDDKFVYGCELKITGKDLLIYLSNKQEDLNRAPITGGDDDSNLSEEEALRKASDQY